MKELIFQIYVVQILTINQQPVDRDTIKCDVSSNRNYCIYDVVFSIADVKVCFYLFRSKGQVPSILTARVDKMLL
jgi:hypothetical protein